ncbi:MAG: DUF4870 domain-containing protein [Anaerolineae bacterium]|nr:DUF4870 domain-containing protein [Anaerolineae bacterium]
MESQISDEGQIPGSSSAPLASELADSWTVAALAHASIAVTLLLSFSGGVGALVGPAIALAIYFGYRQRSRFVAYHALQAVAYQAIGLVMYLVLIAVLVSVTVVAWTISGLLSTVLIGLLLMPLALALTLFMVLILLLAPLGWAGYGLYVAYQVYQGRDEAYWLVGEWVGKGVES